IRELLHGVPVVLGAHDVPAGARAAGGIPHEAGAGGDPHDIRRVPRHGGDLVVVAVRDHRHVLPRLLAGPQRAFDLLDLARAIPLLSLPASSAEMTQDTMLTRPSLLSTLYWDVSSRASHRLVFDLQFVPVTSTVGRHWPSCARRFGAMAFAMSPPIIPPAPR